MNINWFTVIAQVINFLILVWLLKRFLYKPILSAVDEREKKIAGQLEEAASKKATAQKEQEEFKQKNVAFDQQKKALMDKAIADTATERQQLLEETRSEADKLRSTLEAAAKKSQESLNRALFEKTQREVFAISRKALTDLASQSLEEQSVTVFIRKLHELKGDERKKMTDTFTANAGPVLIRSAFELPEKQQAEIKKAVSDISGTPLSFQFSTAPQLISGIEMTVKGYRLSWSISEYLNAMEKNMASTREEDSKTAQSTNVEAEHQVQSGKKPAEVIG